MTYLGGKAKIAKQLVSFMVEDIKGKEHNNKFYEPFFGSGAISFELIKQGYDFGFNASDLQPDLICFFKAIQSGWVPNFIDESEYKRLRQEKEPSPERALAAFCLSFGGKYFGGYSRNSERYNYFQSALNSIEKMREPSKKINFNCCSYLDLEIEDNSLVYCDIPYADTTKYFQGKFDSEQFFDWAYVLGQRCNVYISEYQAPENFECVFSIERKLNLRSKNGCEIRVEKLFKPIY